MALIRPVVDLVRRRLRVSVPKGPGNDKASFDVGLDEEDIDVQDDEGFESPPFFSQGRRARVCSESVEPLMYPPSHPSSRILTDFLGIPCVLARLPSGASTRHAHYAAPGTGTAMGTRMGDTRSVPVPILLSNESPFLLINSASVDAVRTWVESSRSDDMVKGEFLTPDDQVDPASFRANLAVRPSTDSSCRPSRYQSGEKVASLPSPPSPFVEDTWDLVVSPPWSWVSRVIDPSMNHSHRTSGLKYSKSSHHAGGVGWYASTSGRGSGGGSHSTRWADIDGHLRVGSCLECTWHIGPICQRGRFKFQMGTRCERRTSRRRRRLLETRLFSFVVIAQLLYGGVLY
jgi:hypothetical protein